MDGGTRAALRHLRTLAAVRTAAGLGDGDLLGRFAEAHDEAAFTALVERHGPMVLRVCRRVLGHAQDAEDACQATFLVLVRRAASVRNRASVASWLYGVAYRTSRKLQASRARLERGFGDHEDVADERSQHDPSWREVRSLLDEELQRLPERYRAPLVLCYLEGLTRDEAARRLGLSLNRLRGRLDYGRRLFRGRLARRGVALPAVLLGGLLAREASATVPPLLVVSTVTAAALPAAGRGVPAGLVPARVLALTEGMVRTMTATKLKVTAAAILLLAGLAAGVCAVWQPAPAAEPPAKEGPAAYKPDWLDDPLYRASEALVGWWPADGHLFDLAGTNHGTPVEPVAFTEGIRGGGFSFPDGKGAVTVGRPAGLANTFTLALWANPTGPRESASPLHRYTGTRGQRYAVYPTYGGGEGKEAGVGLSVATNGVGVFEHTYDNCPCVLADDTAVKGWTHVAVVYARGKPTLYVNGEAVKTGETSPWSVFPGSHFGDPYPDYYGPYQGQIDEPMVFGRALTADEVKAVLRASRPEKGEDRGAALSEAAFGELWKYLAGERAPRSLFAVHRLAAGGDGVVTRLRPLVRPAPVTGKPSVEELVRQLDDDEFTTRARATRLLIDKGAGVVPKLRAQLKADPSAEVRTRIEKILEHFNEVGRGPEGLRALRAVAVLSRIDTPASRELLAELADGPEATPATVAARAALARLSTPEKVPDR